MTLNHKLLVFVDEEALEPLQEAQGCSMIAGGSNPLPPIVVTISIVHFILN